MPDARASRKRQIELSRGQLQARTLPARVADVPYRVSGPGLELRRAFVVRAGSNRVDLIPCRARPIRFRAHRGLRSAGRERRRRRRLVDEPDPGQIFQFSLPIGGVLPCWPSVTDKAAWPRLGLQAARVVR